jgi:hypothetical protein
MRGGDGRGREGHGRGDGFVESRFESDSSFESVSSGEAGRRARAKDEGPEGRTKGGGQRKTGEGCKPALGPTAQAGDAARAGPCGSKRARGGARKARASQAVVDRSWRGFGYTVKRGALGLSVKRGSRAAIDDLGPHYEHLASRGLRATGLSRTQGPLAQPGALGPAPCCPSAERSLSGSPRGLGAAWDAGARPANQSMSWSINEPGR